MAHGLKLVQTGAHLRVRVESMLQGAHGPRFIGQIALGHAHIGGAEDALARAGVGLGQHRYHGHARKSAHGLHTDARQQRRILVPIAQIHQFAIGSHQHLLANEAAAFALQGMALDRLEDLHALAHIFQRLERALHALGGGFARLGPGLDISFAGRHGYQGQKL